MAQKIDIMKDKTDSITYQDKVFMVEFDCEYKITSTIKEENIFFGPPHIKEIYNTKEDSKLNTYGRMQVKSVKTFPVDHFNVHYNKILSLFLMKFSDDNSRFKKILVKDLTERNEG